MGPAFNIRRNSGKILRVLCGKIVYNPALPIAALETDSKEAIHEI
jgi:hypothetical protein